MPDDSEAAELAIEAGDAIEALIRDHNYSRSDIAAIVDNAFSNAG